MLVSEILKRGARSIGALSQGQELKPAEAVEALDTFNTTIQNLFGQEVGLQIDPVSLTAAATAQVWGNHQIVLAAPATLTLPANPQEGWIVGITDAGNTFDTQNLTVAPNNRRISTGTVGAYQTTSRVISTEGYSARFFYRGDAGWTEIQTLALTDSPYFPVEFHGDLADIFASAIYGQYWPGQAVDQKVEEAAMRARQKLAGRYNGRVMSQRARQTA